MKSFDKLTNGDTPVLVDFFATWCGPCRMMHPVMIELKKRIGDRSRIVKMNIDAPANREMITIYNIRSVPTLMFFRGGELLWRKEGLKSADEIYALMEEFL